MASLRYIGRHETFDSCFEHCGISESTLSRFFHEWINAMSRLKDTFLRPPSGADLAKHLEVYRRLGFPGCFFSTDGVHVEWPYCPAGWRVHFQGKVAKKATVGYNVSPAHPCKAF